MADDITLFDRKAVRQHRRRAALSNGTNDFLSTEISNRLIDRLQDVRRTFDVALDIGGALVGAKGKVAATRIVTADTSTTRLRVKGGTYPVTMDEEFFPFPTHSFNLITSCLSLHWANDLPGALSQIRKALSPDGLFLAAILGGDTLIELRHAFIEAEIEIMGNTSPHTSPMVKTTDAAALLQRAGFTIPVVDTDTLTVTYDNIFGLMHDLRSMGETNSVVTRNRYFLRRETVFTAEKCYRTLYGTKNGKIPATFQIIWLTGWAPHESQQKAIPRGSAAKSLAKTLGTDKYPTG